MRSGAPGQRRGLRDRAIDVGVAEHADGKVRRLHDAIVAVERRWLDRIDAKVSAVAGQHATNPSARVVPKLEHAVRDAFARAVDQATCDDRWRRRMVTTYRPKAGTQADAEKWTDGLKRRGDRHVNRPPDAASDDATASIDSPENLAVDAARVPRAE